MWLNAKNHSDPHGRKSCVGLVGFESGAWSWVTARFQRKDVICGEDVHANDLRTLVRSIPDSVFRSAKSQVIPMYRIFRLSCRQ